MVLRSCRIFAFFFKFDAWKASLCGTMRIHTNLSGPPTLWLQELRKNETYHFTIRGVKIIAVVIVLSVQI